MVQLHHTIGQASAPVYNVEWPDLARLGMARVEAQLTDWAPHRRVSFELLSVGQELLQIGDLGLFTRPSACQVLDLGPQLVSDLCTLGGTTALAEILVGCVAIVGVAFFTARTTCEVNCVVAPITQTIMRTALVFADQGSTVVARHPVVLPIHRVIVVDQGPDRGVGYTYSHLSVSLML